MSTTTLELSFTSSIPSNIITTLLYSHTPTLPAYPPEPYHTPFFSFTYQNTPSQTSTQTNRQENLTHQPHVLLQHPLQHHLDQPPTSRPPTPTPRQRKWSLARFQFPTSKSKPTPETEANPPTTATAPNPSSSSNPFSLSLARTKTVLHNEKRKPSKGTSTPPWIEEARRASVVKQQQQQQQQGVEEGGEDNDSGGGGEEARRGSKTSSLGPMELESSESAVAAAEDGDSSAPSPGVEANNKTQPLSEAYNHLHHLPAAPLTTDASPPTSPPPIPPRAPTRAQKASQRHALRASERATSHSRRASKAMEASARKASIAAQRELDTAKADLRDWEWHNERCGCERFAPRTGGGCQFAVLRGGGGGGGRFDVFLIGFVFDGWWGGGMGGRRD
ncbi:hypothetical protein Q7P37_003157 [Cladosporium fusiforme]